MDLAFAGKEGILLAKKLKTSGNLVTMECKLNVDASYKDSNNYRTTTKDYVLFYDKTSMMEKTSPKIIFGDENRHQLIFSRISVLGNFSDALA